MKTLEDGRTPIEKYVDVFWKKSIIFKGKEEDSEFIEKAVRNMLSEMLYLGEAHDDSQLEGRERKHLDKNLLEHQERAGSS